MTRPRDAEQDIPDAARPTWDELNNVAIPRRSAAVAELEQANERCRQLLVALLRAGVRRERLVGRPYQNSRLTQIQREEGLTRLRDTAP